MIQSDRKIYLQNYRLRNRVRIAEYNKSYATKNKENIIQYQKTWTKLNQDRIAIQRKEYRLLNRDKIRQYKKDWYEKNKEKSDLYKRLWHKEHYEEMKQYKVNYMKKYRKTEKYKLCKIVSKHNRRLWNKTLTPILVQQVYEENVKKYNTLTCELCFKPILFGSDSLEHFQPLSRGGTNERYNLGIAHRRCNSSKNDKTLQEYINGGNTR
jgi:5-methylcytosine-specific restriction endonuclease McrA